MAEYKLTYFSLRGLAEPIRFLLKYGGIAFEDKRFEREEWPQVKSSFTFGQLPILTANGKHYHQSVAITRFVAKKVKLTGKDEWEDLEIDAMIDTIGDFRLKLGQYFFESDETVKASRKNILHKETIPFYTERLEKIAKANNGHLACNKLTWADLYFAALFDTLNYFAETDMFSKCPNLCEVKNKVVAIPAIKKWVETRPKTDF